MLTKVQGGNVDIGGDLTVSESTTLNSLTVTGDDTFDTILTRRTDADACRINLRTLQVYVNNVNILPGATYDTVSIGSGSIGSVIEFMTSNNLVAHPKYLTFSASNIQNNTITGNYSLHSADPDTAYISLYIPLTQSFNISDVQTFV
jgi:hypothetical protein